MNRFALIGLVVLLLVACSKQQMETQGATPRQDGTIFPLCSLPEISESSDGKQVSIRGRMMVGAHEVFLTDERCPDVQLDLESATDGPGISLCSSKELVKKFGCPGGNENGPIVTAVGILKKSHTPKYARIVVEEMTDFASVHGAKQL